MKYGIKHKSGDIEAISRFSNDIVPLEFIEITQIKYEEFIRQININPFATYDHINNTIVLDNQALVEANTKRTKDDMRDRLMSLSNELDLRNRLSEDTTVIQAEFDTLKAQYDAI